MTVHGPTTVAGTSPRHRGRFYSGARPTRHERRGRAQAGLGPGLSSRKHTAAQTPGGGSLPSAPPLSGDVEGAVTRVFKHPLIDRLRTGGPLGYGESYEVEATRGDCQTGVGLDKTKGEVECFLVHCSTLTPCSQSERRPRSLESITTQPTPRATIYTRKGSTSILSSQMDRR